MEKSQKTLTCLYAKNTQFMHTYTQRYLRIDIYTLMDTFTYRISIRTYFYTYIHTPNYTDIHKHICHKHYRYSHFHSIINKKI